jgi:enoyl-CoA hydratase/carnithine racemase
MSYETIIYEVGSDHVATITLNRPQAMNSFTAKMLAEFDDVWERIKRDDNVRAVVLKAADGRAFCTGADIVEGEKAHVFTYDNVWNMQDPGAKLGAKANEVWKPLIVAVHGLCCGGAFYFLNEADIIICSEDAQFFDPHVTYGLVCACEPIGLTYRIPLGDVMRIALLGNDERMSAQTAKDIRLVSEVLPKEKLWARAHELAAKIAGKSPAAVQGSVRAIWNSFEMTRKMALSHAFDQCQYGRPFGQEGIDHAAAIKGKKVFEVR